MSDTFTLKRPFLLVDVRLDTQYTFRVAACSSPDVGGAWKSSVKSTTTSLPESPLAREMTRPVWVVTVSAGPVSLPVDVGASQYTDASKLYL